MGVKVGGGETQQSYRRLDLRINGSGFDDAFSDRWEKEHWQKRARLRKWLKLQIGKYDKQSFF